MTNEPTPLEKYTSHTLFKRDAKGLCVRGELDTEQTATYWPQVPLSLTALLSRSDGLLNRGSWRHSPLWELVLTTASYLQLTEPVCGTGLYNCLTSTQFKPSTFKVRPWYLRPDAPIIYTGASLIWQLGRGSICYALWLRVVVLFRVPSTTILGYSGHGSNWNSTLPWDEELEPYHPIKFSIILLYSRNTNTSGL